MPRLAGETDDIADPGNLLGMMALYALLALGIVKLSWFETAGAFLIRHLAFFFVPITVGLMDARYLFAVRGLAIVPILAVSAALGIGLAGWVTQAARGSELSGAAAGVAMGLGAIYTALAAPWLVPLLLR